MFANPSIYALSFSNPRLYTDTTGPGEKPRHQSRQGHSTIPTREFQDVPRSRQKLWLLLLLIIKHI